MAITLSIKLCWNICWDSAMQNCMDFSVVVVGIVALRASGVTIYNGHFGDNIWTDHLQTGTGFTLWITITCRLLRSSRFTQFIVAPLQTAQNTFEIWEIEDTHHQSCNVTMSTCTIWNRSSNHHWWFINSLLICWFCECNFCSLYMHTLLKQMLIFKYTRK